MASSPPIKDVNGLKDGDPTEGPGSELYDAEALDLSDTEKLLNHLRQDIAKTPREEQRVFDREHDHLIFLLSRQKKTSRKNIFCVYSIALAIFTLQGIAMFNLQSRVGEVGVTELAHWVATGYVSNTDAEFRDPLAAELPTIILSKTNATKISITDFPELDFCFENERLPNVVFNLGAGLLMIYAFIFNDLWYVIMRMPLVRSFPGKEPNGILMVSLLFTLMVISAALLAWVGVISGLQVLSGVADFKLILLSSVELFLVLMIDDVFLPAIRYVVEERGNLDPVTGKLNDKALKTYTHGKQYYKPGYGASFYRRLTHHNKILRVVALFAVCILIGVLVVPFAATIARALVYMRPCALSLN